MPRKKELSYQTEGDVFATRLRQIMKERGENQTTLAAKITQQSGTLQRQSISQYMSGQSKPDTRRLAAICKALNVSADYLIGVTDVAVIEPSIRAAAEYTHLSEQALWRLRSMNPDASQPVDALISNPGFFGIYLALAFYRDNLEDLTQEMNEFCLLMFGSKRTKKKVQ